MRNIWFVAVFCLFALIFMSNSLHATGGTYIDDFSGNCNGVTWTEGFEAFYWNANDSFWHGLPDTIRSNDCSHSGSYSLLLNGGIQCNMSMPVPGLLETSFWVYFPEVSENNSDHFYMNLLGYSGSSFDVWGGLNTDVALRPEDGGYAVHMEYSAHQTKYDPQAGHDSVTLADVKRDAVSNLIMPGQWNQITLRLDQPAALASYSLNGQQLIAFSCNADSLWPITWLNLGVSDPTRTDLPEPSSILIMLAGLGGLSGTLVHQKRRTGLNC